MTDAELAYLYYALPFRIQSFFGGDPAEFLEGLRAAMALRPARDTQRHLIEWLEELYRGSSEPSNT